MSNFLKTEKTALLNELANEIAQLYREYTHPFPYEGCRAVITKFGQAFEDLIPDLDLFFYDVWSYTGSTEWLMNLTPEEAKMMQRKLKFSFFEEHPQYKVAESFITADNNPRFVHSF